MDGVDDGGIMRPEERMQMQSTSASGMNLVTASEDVARDVDLSWI